MAHIFSLELCYGTKQTVLRARVILNLVERRKKKKDLIHFDSELPSPKFVDLVQAFIHTC